MSLKTLMFVACCAALVCIADSLLSAGSSDYRGCWKDGRDRALPHHAGHVAIKADCITRCRKAELPFAGIQYGGECWCGYHTYKRFGKSINCSHNCKRDKRCGGTWKNSVYATGRPAKYTQPKGYMGCWKDSWSRALPVWGGYVYGIRNCIRNCRNKGQKYAGIQYTNRCWCGSNYKRYGKSHKCNYTCKLKKGVCGGWWSNSVYKV